MMPSLSKPSFAAPAITAVVIAVAGNWWTNNAVEQMRVGQGAMWAYQLATSVNALDNSATPVDVIAIVFEVLSIVSLVTVLVARRRTADMSDG